eukprot:11542367-Alexandrium_andersonii.AAC.1
MAPDLAETSPAWRSWRRPRRQRSLQQAGKGCRPSGPVRPRELGSRHEPQRGPAQRAAPLQ